MCRVILDVSLGCYADAKDGIGGTGNDEDEDADDGGGKQESEEEKRFGSQFWRFAPSMLRETAGPDKNKINTHAK